MPRPAMMEQETWAEALILHRTHGEAATSHAVERISALARAGDAAGVVRWRMIADHLDELGSADRHV